MPRPPIQHHKHIISFDPAAEVLVRDLMDAYRRVHGIKAAGRALQGALSHPAGYLSVTGAVILAAHTIPGIREIVIGFEKKQAEAAGRAVEEFVKTGWRSVTEGSAARNAAEREMYEQWIDDLWKGIQWAFQTRGGPPD